jgi:hypothetical protein
MKYEIKSDFDSSLVCTSLPVPNLQKFSFFKPTPSDTMIHLATKLRFKRKKQA